MRIIVLTGAIAAAGLLAGCGQQASQTTPQAPPQAAAAPTPAVAGTKTAVIKVTSGMT